MEDLKVNFIGAVVLSFMSYFYILNREKYSFVEGLFIKKEKSEINDLN